MTDSVKYWDNPRAIQELEVAMREMTWTQSCEDVNETINSPPQKRLRP
jgi:hypothetical protein